MKSRKSYQLEEFINDAQSDLEELKEIEAFLELDESESNNIVSAAVKDSFRQTEFKGIQFLTDGYIDLTITGNGMLVTASFYPPSNGKMPATLYTITDQLEKKEIRKGIDWDKIKTELRKCNETGMPVENAVIASGKKPTTEIAEHFVIEQKLLDNKTKLRAAEAKIDFREVSPLVLVKAGDILARKAAHQYGEYGYTVHGDQLPFSITKVMQIKPGSNTRTESDCIIAECDGSFEVFNNTLVVKKVLQIWKDVDYHTGNIKFPGDVIIAGEVKDGFKIEADGSVFCNHTLDATEVNCGNNLTVNHGIIGRKKGAIKVKGTIKAKFIENCFVEADKDITIDVGIMNSAVYTSGSLKLVKQGIIVGGTIYAQNGIVAIQLGSAMGPRTELHCGINFQILNKLQWIRDNNIKLVMKLKQVEEQLKHKEAGKSPELENLKMKITESIHKLNEAATGLIFKLDKEEDAEILVLGKAYPGVYIEICHMSYVVNAVITRSRFRLDKKTGSIAVEKLKI